MQGKVILLFGGESQERLVSVATAQNLSRFLPDALCWFWAANEAVFEVDSSALQNHENPFTTPFEPETQALFPTLRTALDSKNYREYVFVLGLHGGRGEDGTVQSWLEERGLRFTGSGSLACSKAFDKVWAKRILTDFPVKMAPSLVIKGNEKSSLSTLESLYAEHGKIVVKPVHDGSSVGLCIVDGAAALHHAIDMVCSQPDRLFLAEPFISGPELTCGVVDENGEPRALVCTEIRAEAGRSFDYDGKYLGHGVREVTPAEVSPELVKKAQEVAVIAHKALGLVGYSRTDVIMSGNEAYYLETNTLPGLTRASLVPQQLEAEGISMASFIESQIQIALRGHDQH